MSALGKEQEGYGSVQSHGLKTDPTLMFHLDGKRTLAAGQMETAATLELTCIDWVWGGRDRFSPAHGQEVSVVTGGLFAN